MKSKSTKRKILTLTMYALLFVFTSSSCATLPKEASSEVLSEYTDNSSHLSYLESSQETNSSGELTFDFDKKNVKTICVRQGVFSYTVERNNEAFESLLDQAFSYSYKGTDLDIESEFQSTYELVFLTDDNNEVSEQSHEIWKSYRFNSEALEKDGVWYIAQETGYFDNLINLVHKERAEHDAYLKELPVSGTLFEIKEDIVRIQIRDPGTIWATYVKGEPEFDQLVDYINSFEYDGFQDKSFYPLADGSEYALLLLTDMETYNGESYEFSAVTKHIEKDSVLYFAKDKNYFNKLLELLEADGEYVGG